jgi:hypothetical protein
MLDYALAYAGLGWYVIPCFPMRGGICACGRPQCVSPGKHPANEIGLTAATIDEAQIRAWWAAMPDASIGVVMEPSGLLAFDLDEYHGDLSKLAALEHALGPLPSTVTQRSGSGQGFHAIFKSPGFPSRGVLGGIVIRSKAYIVVAPSNHASGGNYAWQEGLGPTEVAVAELPDVWKEALRKSSDVGQAGVPTEEPEWLAKIPNEQRIADMKAHFARESGEVKGTSDPGKTFNVVRGAIRSYGVRDSEAALEAAMVYDTKCVPPWGARMARHVWSAYQRATSPVWGAAYRGEDQRLEALGLTSAPVLPAYERPADIMVQATLQSVKGKRTSDPQKIVDKALISQILDKKFLGSNELLAAQAMLRNCPPGTTDDQLVGFLMGTNMREDRARELLKQARPLTSSASLADALPVTPAPAALSGVSASLPEADFELMQTLKMDAEGEGVKNSPNNLFEILSKDSVVGGKIRFNGLTKQVEMTAAHFGEISSNVLATDVMNWLDKKWQLTTHRTLVEDQLLLIARQNEYNPVADYLKAQAWDRKPRIDTWLIDYCGAEDTPFNRRVGAMWMIAACARGIVPGSKVDTVLILEGRQGIGKSKAASVLAGPWFSDSPLVIGNKDSMQMASYRWIIELAELASLRASESESQKAFISARIDNYRPPYGKAPEEFKRYAVFIGSTNQGEYLPDETGNRRYWPVIVGSCDVVRLSADRDQLWAEATYRYLHADLNPELANSQCPGERWWFETDAEQDMAAVVVEKRRPENTWAGLIREWSRRNSVGVNVRRQWTLAEIAKSSLNIEIEKLPGKQKAISVAIKEAGLVPALGDEGQPMWRLPDGAVPEIKESDTQGLRDSN